MSDPKDELGARFDERRADTGDSIETRDDQSSADDTGNTGDTGNSSDTGDASDSNKPGPDRNESATRHRQQVPMYLPDDKADDLNKLYERLDGRSKVAGDGGIEKHADFMEALVDLAVENEEELAARMEIRQE